MHLKSVCFIDRIIKNNVMLGVLLYLLILVCELYRLMREIVRSIYQLLSTAWCHMAIMMVDLLLLLVVAYSRDRQ